MFNFLFLVSCLADLEAHYASRNALLENASQHAPYSHSSPSQLLTDPTIIAPPRTDPITIAQPRADPTSIIAIAQAAHEAALARASGPFWHKLSRASQNGITVDDILSIGKGR